MSRWLVEALTVGGWAPVGEVLAKDEFEAKRAAYKLMSRLPKERVRVVSAK